MSENAMEAIHLDSKEKQEKKYASSDFLRNFGFPAEQFRLFPSEGKKNLLIDAVVVSIRGMFQMSEGDVNLYAENFVNSISSRATIDFVHIVDFTIDGSGNLELTMQDGTLQKLDIKPEGRLLISRIAVERMRQTQSREILKEEINSEAYLGGSIIAVFDNIAVSTATTGVLAYGTALTGSTAYHSARGIARGAQGVATSYAKPTNTYTRIDNSTEARALLKKIWYKNTDGKMLSVDVSDLSKGILTRSEHINRIVKLLAQKGIVMTEVGRFDRLPRIMTTKFLAEMDKIKDPSQIGRTTPEQLERWKAMVHKEVLDFATNNDKLTPSQFLKNFDIHLNKILTGTGKLGFTLAEKTLFWAVFFRTYGKNMQDTGALYASLAEWGLFTVGARAGSYAPGLLKFPTAIVGGAGLVVLGHIGGKKFNLDKKFWQQFPDREDEHYKYTGEEGNSLIGSILSGNAVHEYLDKGNVDFRLSPKGGLDVRAPSYNGIDTRGSLNPQQWITKRKGIVTGDNVKWYNPTSWLKSSEAIGQDTTVPEIDILSTSINFRTDAREWMGITVGRDVDLWNKRVTEYRSWLSNFINQLTDDYSKNNGIFRLENVKKVKLDESQERSYLRDYELDANGKPKTELFSGVTILKDSQGKWYEPVNPQSLQEKRKELLLRQRLQSALGINEFTSIKANLGVSAATQNELLIDNIVGQVGLTAREPNRQKKQRDVNFIVNNYTEYLFINEDYLSAEKIKLKRQEILLNKEIDDFSKSITPDKRKYFLSLFSRILNKKYVIGRVQVAGKSIKDQKEEKIFEDLITDATEVTDHIILTKQRRDGLFSEGIDGMTKKITQSDIFYQLLNKMVDYKRQNDFVSNIEKYGRGHKWHMHETSASNFITNAKIALGSDK